MSMRRCGASASVAASGLALPMSRPRYTSAESTLMISVPSRCAHSTASAVLPDAVGPMSAIARGRVSAGMRGKDSGCPLWEGRKARSHGSFATLRSTRSIDGSVASGLSALPPEHYHRPMSRLKALGFLLVFIVPALMPAAAWLGVATGWPDAMAWFPLLFLFVLLPAIDFLLGHDPANVAPGDEAAVARSRWFIALTLLAVPVQAVLLAWSAAWFAHAGFGAAGMVGWLLAQGVVG